MVIMNATKNQWCHYVLIEKLFFGLVLFTMTEKMVSDGFCLIGNPTWKGKPTLTMFDKNETNSSLTTIGKKSVKRFKSFIKYQYKI